MRLRAERRRRGLWGRLVRHAQLPYVWGCAGEADELGLLGAIEGERVRAPRVLATCDDEAVIGAPFYVMERVEGETLARRLAVAKYATLYVFPQAHAGPAGDPYARRGRCGFDVTPAEGYGIGAGEPPVDLRRMLEERP